MSCGIIRIQKMTAGSVKGIEIHDRREKDGISHTNSDIDWSRTHRNYDLAEKDSSFYVAVQERIRQLNLPKAVRKDAIVMTQALVTSDRTFFENLSETDQRSYFEKSLAFIQEQYGKENIISATVHLDETTPHMHVNFVPVTTTGKLSAKELFTRSSLRELQDKFYEQVGKAYGLERGERGSTARHLEVAEYKLKMTEQKATEKALEVQQAAKEVQALESNKNALKEQLVALENKFKGTVLQLREIHAIQPTKTLTGIKGVTIEDIENLKKTAVEGCILKDKYVELQRAYQQIKGKRQSLDEKLSLTQKVTKLEKYERIFNKLPAEQQRQLLELEKKDIIYHQTR